jgi:hypothetical protein
MSRAAAAFRRRCGVKSTSSLFEVETWFAGRIFSGDEERYWPTAKEAKAYAGRFGKPEFAEQRKVRVARRGRSLYLLTPIRKGPK